MSRWMGFWSSAQTLSTCQSRYRQVNRLYNRLSCHLLLNNAGLKHLSTIWRHELVKCGGHTKPSSPVRDLCVCLYVLTWSVKSGWFICKIIISWSDFTDFDLLAVVRQAASAVQASFSTCKNYTPTVDDSTKASHCHHPDPPLCRHFLQAALVFLSGVF